MANNEITIGDEVKIINGQTPSEKERLGQTGTIIAINRYLINNMTVYTVQFPDNSDTLPFYIHEIELVLPVKKLEHTHSYKVVLGAEALTIRYCVTCGTAWVLEDFGGWYWKSIKEPNK